MIVPIDKVKGVGEATAKLLAQIGINTALDLVENVPRAYNDYSEITPVAKIRPGMVTLKVTINSAVGRYVRRGMHVTEAIASDKTGSVKLVWFNQPYRAAGIKPASDYFVTGEFAYRRGRVSIVSPAVELVSDFPLNTARIVPIYRERKGLKSAQLRRHIKAAFDVQKLDETLPSWLVKQNGLIDRHQALLTMHFPETIKSLSGAKRRLGFEEVFELTLASLLNKKENNQEHSLPIPFKEDLARKFVAKLPFKLTDAQRRVIWQSYLDLARDTPMNRLVEGDVGSGKTVVAVMVALMVMEQGFQVALMAPTELLARQHAASLYKLLKSVGRESEVGLLVGSLGSKAKAEAHKQINAGNIRLVVGTNALIQDKVDMHNLGLVIVDEQHRFGVETRKKLQAKAGRMPHVLHMTATPIPRSLALTLYGELDISVIDELPAGRKPIITKIINSESLEKLCGDIDKQLSAGRQAFFVCPIISEGPDAKLWSAEKLHERLSKTYFKHRRVGLLHGRLQTVDKEAIMSDFVDGKYDVLIATTVIEVGVDVPNATVMVVVGAERFGLAQIHQLRGRVGRSEHQAHCYLVPSNPSAPNHRLEVLTYTSDGFKLAEYDLELRGPGAIYGTAQHGALDLRVAKLTDTKLIAEARRCAQEFIKRGEDLLQYKELAERVNRLRAITNLN